MASAELQDRSQYLSLALFSQKVISVLMEYVDENKSAKLKSALEEALNLLVQPEQPSSRRRHAAFSSYEHLRTLDEVWSTKERLEATKIVKALLRAPKDERSKSAAEKLILLFSKLQDQALWNFEQPKPVSQKVMRRLCQMA
ncbi:MAG TPA: hypothetical protein VFW31_11555 [Candidatus Angelobacter sp.]|nr:hypothetical protein [Candidatus Angelobacter sp.]